MTALEEYTAHHPDTVEEIMHRWPWRRFEGMFKRHLLRKAREELRQMRDLRVAALDANTNFDAKENAEVKQQRLEQYQESYLKGIEILYSAPEQRQPTPEEEDPLFAPIRRRANQMREEIARPIVEQAGMGRQLIEATS
jgi:hypothetical protein